MSRQKEIIVKMYDDEHHPVPVKVTNHNEHVSKKFRINSSLWKNYLNQQKKYEALKERVLEERVKILEGVTRDQYGDYEED